MNSRSPKNKLLPNEEQAIKDMEEFFNAHPIEEIVIDLIQVGYDQASCNDEQAVDRDDAIRILLENDEQYNYHNHDFSAHSWMVIGAAIKIKATAAWRNEFPNERAS